MVSRVVVIGVVVFGVVGVVVLVVAGLISGRRQISCGGDWSYDVKCPTGTYCKSVGMGPLAGGICTSYLGFNF